MIVSWLNRAGTVSLRGLVAFGKFWYGFVIGDDWTVAAAVAAALAVTWLLHTAGVAGVVAAAAGRGGRDRGQPSPHQGMTVAHRPAGRGHAVSAEPGGPDPGGWYRWPAGTGAGPGPDREAGPAPVTGGRDVPARLGPPDARRYLQLALAGLWLLDAVLQCQAFMFTKGFAGMLAGAAAGNPRWAAAPVLLAAHLTERDPALANAGFATAQLLIALGIAGRPTVKAGLAASAGWALAVWWLGEGLGGVLAGSASPVTGAPGADAARSRSPSPWRTC